MPWEKSNEKIPDYPTVQMRQYGVKILLSTRIVFLRNQKPYWDIVEKEYERFNSEILSRFNKYVHLKICFLTKDNGLKPCKGIFEKPTRIQEDLMEQVITETLDESLITALPKSLYEIDKRRYPVKNK